MSRFHVLSLMLCAVLCAGAAKAADPREVELKKVRFESWKSWAASDATGMAPMVTDDFVQFSQTATFVDKTTFLTSVRQEHIRK